MKISPIKLHKPAGKTALPPIPKKLITDWQNVVDTELNVPGGTMLTRLEAVYGYLDRYAEFVSTFSVCSKGCSHCCSIDVSVSRLEAEYIMWKGGPAFDQRGRAQTTGHKDACTFLSEDGSCSIYATRPFNCRTFFTLDDPKYCETPEVDHEVYGAASIGYGVSVYAGIAMWIGDWQKAHKLPYRDIRDWFPKPVPEVASTEPKRTLIDRLFGRSRSEG
ncbi:TPA: YkgJ family cysteine cluster protein [Burkholderia cenocepacia]|nr:YkgJ family cysteine cluster protein [Burkholderia cenocepacia]